MKTCIRCWNTEKEIRKENIKTCYVGWWSYNSHDYTKPMTEQENLEEWLKIIRDSEALLTKTK